MRCHCTSPCWGRKNVKPQGAKVRRKRETTDPSGLQETCATAWMANIFPGVLPLNQSCEPGKGCVCSALCLCKSGKPGLKPRKMRQLESKQHREDVPSVLIPARAAANSTLLSGLVGRGHGEGKGRIPCATAHPPLAHVTLLMSFALVQSPSPDLGQDWDSRSHGSLELLYPSLTTCAFRSPYLGGRQESHRSKNSAVLKKIKRKKKRKNKEKRKGKKGTKSLFHICNLFFPFMLTNLKPLEI